MATTPVSHVAVVDRSALSDEEVALLVEAYRGEVAPFCAVWNLPPPGLAVYGKTHDQQIQEEAALFIVDSGNDPDAFGWHTILGIARYGYIDVGMCRLYGEPVSRVFGHELYELIADPDCDRWAGPYKDGSHVALEVCDPVQRNSRTKTVDDPILGKGDVEIADYVVPGWFDEGSTTGPWSEQNNAPAALAIAEGGYVIREQLGAVVASGRVKNFGRTFRRLAEGRVEE
jgi:hypothetical protein